MRAHRVCVCSRGQGFQVLPRVAWRFVNELVIDETHLTERHVWRIQEPIYNLQSFLQSINLRTAYNERVLRAPRSGALR